jgi:hypothetical protein
MALIAASDAAVIKRNAVRFDPSVRLELLHFTSDAHAKRCWNIATAQPGVERNRAVQTIGVVDAVSTRCLANACEAHSIVRRVVDACRRRSDWLDVNSHPAHEAREANRP